jgi:hypothetical protein
MFVNVSVIAAICPRSATVAPRGGSPARLIAAVTRVIARPRSEKAVYALVVEGADQGLWSFADKSFQMRAIDDYRAQLFSARGPDAPSPEAAVRVASGDGGGEAVTRTQSTGASPAATAENAPRPRAASAAPKSAAVRPAKRAGLKTVAAKTAAVKPSAKEGSGSGFVTMLTAPPAEVTTQAQN